LALKRDGKDKVIEQQPQAQDEEPDESQKASQGTKHKAKKRKTSESVPQHNDAQERPEDVSESQEDLRAPRTRSGRVRKQVEFLSFNHRDPKSVAMLLYSN
jgi:hypothetical protein